MPSLNRINQQGQKNKNTSNEKKQKAVQIPINPSPDETKKWLTRWALGSTVGITGFSGWLFFS